MSYIGTDAANGPASARAGAGLRVLSRERLVMTALLMLYMLVVLTTTLHHEIWRDEAQAWLIACASRTPADVFDWLRTEGHPALWYLCLWVLSRFTHDPLAMQLFHAAVAIGSGALLALAAPMPRWQRALLMFGYFFVFEYAVISRSYGLGVLLAFGVCALAPYRARAMPWLGVLLLMLANTSVQAAVLAGALGLGLAVDWLLSRRLGNGRAPGRGWGLAYDGSAPATARATGLAAVLCAGGIALSYAQVSRYPHGEPGYRAVMPADQLNDARARAVNPGGMRSAFGPIVEAMVPIPARHDMTFWESNFLTERAGPRALPWLLWAAAVGVSVGLLATVHRPAVAATCFAGVGGLLLCGRLGLLESIRHQGHYFLLFVIGLWLWRVYPALRRGGETSEQRFVGPPPRVARVVRAGRGGLTALLAVLLATHVAVGALAVRHDLRLPFSTARAAAGHIERHYPPDVLVMAWRDVMVTALASELGRPIYHLDSGRYGGPVDWAARNGRHGQRGSGPFPLVRAELEARSVAGGLLVSSQPLPPDGDTAGLEVAARGAMDPAIAPNERFWLYDVSLPADPR